MTDTYRYQCANCDSVRELPSDAERTLRIGCPTCDSIQAHRRCWDCRKCGLTTTDARWPDTPNQDGPLCKQHFGRLLMEMDS